MASSTFDQGGSARLLPQQSKGLANSVRGIQDAVGDATKRPPRE